MIAHGFPPREQDLVVQMVRWLMLGIFATSISGVCAAMLNANHRFALYSELGIFALVLASVPC